VEKKKMKKTQQNNIKIETNMFDDLEYYVKDTDSITITGKLLREFKDRTLEEQKLLFQEMEEEKRREKCKNNENNFISDTAVKIVDLGQFFVASFFWITVVFIVSWALNLGDEFQELTIATILIWVVLIVLSRVLSCIHLEGK
jgi:hypothetical protein